MNEATANGAAGGAGTAKRSFARHIPTIARILLGLLFVVTGLNGFLDFIPKPKEPLPAFVQALAATPYMMTLISGTQLLSGVLLVTGLFVPLALALLAPVVVNIVLFHVYINRTGLEIALVVLLLELYLAFSYRGAFASMLAIRAKPGGK
jgi:uncharacterized membrane protein YphA (DoxX/SURF4 family)